MVCFYFIYFFFTQKLKHIVVNTRIGTSNSSMYGSNMQQRYCMSSCTFHATTFYIFFKLFYYDSPALYSQISQDSSSAGSNTWRAVNKGPQQIFPEQGPASWGKWGAPGQGWGGQGPNNWASCYKHATRRPFLKGMLVGGVVVWLFSKRHHHHHHHKC